MADISKEYIDDVLAHAGILGQKWRQRRYQNPDGTYTELGKIRKRAYYRDKYSQYSNEELKEMTDRNTAIKNYEMSLANRGDPNAHKLENAAKNADNTKKLVVASAAILTGVTALAVAGKTFKDDWSKEGKGRTAFNELRDAAKDLLKNGKEAAGKVFGSAKHSDIDEERVEDFLAHHGILGQKWGVRRYQNEDGTLTPLGRKRYGVGKYDELTPSQKRDITKRDKELRTRQEADFEAKMAAKKQKQDYKLEKKRLANERRKIDQDADVAKRDIKADRDISAVEVKEAAAEKRQKEIDAKAEKAVKRIGIGLAAVTALIGGAVLLKAAKGESGEETKQKVKEKVKEKAKEVAEKVKEKKGGGILGQKWGVREKISVVRVREAADSVLRKKGKDVYEVFRDNDDVMKSAVDILRNNRGQLLLPGTAG